MMGALVTICGLTLVGNSPTFAASSSAPQDGGYLTAIHHEAFKGGNDLDPWKFDAYECTSYVAYLLNNAGVAFNDSFEGTKWGDAGHWIAAAKAAGVPSGTTPEGGAVAVWADSGTGVLAEGHVAYVSSVSGGVGNLSEYNAKYFYPSYNPPGWDNTYTTANNPSGKPPTEYLYFSNVSQSGPPPGDVALTGDVNGDGKADAVLVNPTSGDVWVALSTGSNFSRPVEWSANPDLANASRYFLADVNGDGKADIAAYFAATGDWVVGLSSGSGFWPPTLWAANEGTASSGTTNEFVADVNGDGRADVVTFDEASGNWFVDESSGSGFWGPPSPWIGGDGVGSTTQVVADFNGDGKADAGVYFASNGNWYVGLSTGTYFGYPGQWSAGHGMNSNLQLAGDVNGDGRADIGYFYNNGTWEVGTSSGSGFWQPTYWAYNEGNGGTTQFLADVTGDHEDAVVTYWAAVSGQPAGMWTVDTSSGSGFYGPPNQWLTGFGNNET
jgi:surface antigen